MMHWLLFIYPVLAAFVTIAVKQQKKLDLVIILHALLQVSVGIAGYINRAYLAPMDNLGLMVFLITSTLYLAVAFYRYGTEPDAPIKNYRIHTICLMFFVAAMDGACLAQDLGLIWIFVEATTLASAMLISFEHHKSSLEAAWKYLFICSVGIALAFVGILLLVIAQPDHASLSVDKMVAGVQHISPFWLKMAFVFIMVGFGTKIGLAPLHFWLPDAHSEAPAPISALLSGALLNTALIPVLRINKLMQAAGMEVIAQQVYLFMGFLSIFIAAVFMLKSRNYKRVLAYSSIENMGIIMLAFGAGGGAVYAGYLHILGHSLIKAAFFLTAGNVVAIYHDKQWGNVSALLDDNRPSGWLWLIAFAFIIGLPPSPLFYSEFRIAMALIYNGHYVGFAVLMLLLGIIAWAMGRVSLQITMGKGTNKTKLKKGMIIAPAILLLLAAIIGIWLPVLNLP